MATPKLSAGAVKIIEGRIDDLFERLKYRALGPRGVAPGKHLFIQFTRVLSLPGIYEQAASEEGGRPDRDIVERLIEITSDFLDKHRADTKARVKQRIQDLLHEVEDGRIKSREFRPRIEQELSSILDDVTTNVQRVISTQTQYAQTLGTKEGIDQINTRMGIDDPVVCFIPVKDDRLCDECRRVHLLPDGRTPRVFRSSEVKAGWHKRGEDQPSWSLMHPHCRCTLTTVLPGYGFDLAGRVMYRGGDWQEWGFQRGSWSPPFERKESILYQADPLVKDTGGTLIKADDLVYWHGTPSGDLRGGKTGLHVGSRRAAEQALHARIGYPAEGEWDGTREYGKTKLAGRKTLAARFPGQGWETGFNASFSEDDHLPDPKSLPVFSDGTPMLPTHKPDLFPLRIVGPMSNTPWAPHEDFKANGYMQGQLKRGTAKRGFYYRNVGEDVGSISATVPGPNHIVRLLREQIATKKTEPEVGEPLRKYDIKYADLSHEFRRFGWQILRDDGRHILWHHPEIPGRPIPVKRDHASGSKPIDDDMLRNKYLKQAGLMVSAQAEIIPNPRHEYAAHYRRLGHLPAEEGAAPAKRTWTAPGHGAVEVPIDQLEATAGFEEWRAAKFHALLNQGKHDQVPAISAIRDGDRFLVDQGHEQLEAARRHGMTHVPVRTS